MKKNTIFAAVLLLALSLALSGCGKAGGGDEINFNGIILEINGNSVLVEALEGEDIRRSSDKITFSRQGLDDIGAEAGDTVTVTYTGEIMESYPAQVRAVSWSILEKRSAKLLTTRIVTTGTTAAEYENEIMSILGTVQLDDQVTQNHPLSVQLSRHPA